jgi:hypothetical protein
MTGRADAVPSADNPAGLPAELTIAGEGSAAWATNSELPKETANASEAALSRSGNLAIACCSERNAIRTSVERKDSIRKADGGLLGPSAS